MVLVAIHERAKKLRFLPVRRSDLNPAKSCKPTTATTRLLIKLTSHSETVGAPLRGRPFFVEGFRSLRGAPRSGPPLSLRLQVWQGRPRSDAPTVCCGRNRKRFLLPYERAKGYSIYGGITKKHPTKFSTLRTFVDSTNRTAVAVTYSSFRSYDRDNNTFRCHVRESRTGF